VKVQIKINYENDELYCVECKGRIEINQKYILIFEQLYNNEIIEKKYHTSCVPEDEEEPYICY